MTKSPVISSASLSFRAKWEILTTASRVISNNGRNPNHITLSFRPEGEILTNINKISQSLSLLRNDKISCHFEHQLVISNEVRNLNHNPLSFRTKWEILTLINKISQSLKLLRNDNIALLILRNDKNLVISSAARNPNHITLSFRTNWEILTTPPCHFERIEKS